VVVALAGLMEPITLLPVLILFLQLLLLLAVVVVVLP
jgi:hypothetical protein